MEDKEAPNSAFTMSIKGMAMLTVCSVFSLRNLPSMAEYGWNIIFFLSAAAACFFIPSALVSAELASTYPQRGGVFIWVKEAFGPKLGFLAIFMEWFQNMPWYPAAVTFVATCIAYIFNPELASNRWYIFFTAIFLLWLSTFLNFRGMRLSVFLSNSGVVVGTIIPGFFLIVCALTYVWLGKPVQINLDGGKALIPDLSTARQWMLLAGMMVSLAGMEMSSVHVTSMKNPRSSFPKSIYLSTFLNFRGMRLSVFLSNSGVVVGTIIPGFFLIVCALTYVWLGKPVQINLDGGKALIPDLSTARQWMLLAGMMVSLAGMEMSSVHVTSMKNPRSSFPKSIYLATAIILILSVLGALSISLVVPIGDLSKSAGVCQSFELMLNALGVGWLTPILACLLAYGALASVVTWMNGPSRGLLEVAKEGYLPQYWQYRNSYGMQTRIFILQASLASFLSLSVLIMPSVSDAFWLFLALCSQLYMIMYLLMFAAAIRLKIENPDSPGEYKVPGGRVGMILMSGVAFCTSLIALLCGFIPPEEIINEGLAASLGYVGFLAGGLIIFTIIPLKFFDKFQHQHLTEVKDSAA